MTVAAGRGFGATGTEGGAIGKPDPPSRRDIGIQLQFFAPLASRHLPKKLSKIL